MAAYARWKANARKRRELAIDLRDGRREWSPRWPQWVVYDLQAELTLMEEESRG